MTMTFGGRPGVAARAPPPAASAPSPASTCRRCGADPIRIARSPPFRRSLAATGGRVEGSAALDGGGGVVDHVDDAIEVLGTDRPAHPVLQRHAEVHHRATDAGAAGTGAPRGFVHLAEQRLDAGAVALQLG